MLEKLITIPESIKCDVDITDRFQFSFEAFGLEAIKLCGIIHSDKSAENIMLLSMKFSSDNIFHDNINLRTSSLKKIVSSMADAVKVPCIIFMEYEDKIRICIPKSSSGKLQITDWLYSDFQSKCVRDSLESINGIFESAAKGNPDHYLYGIRQKMELIASNDFHAGIELKNGSDSKVILDQIFENHPEYLERVISRCRTTNVISFKNVYQKLEAEEFWYQLVQDKEVLAYLKEQGIEDVSAITSWISDIRETQIRESQKNFYKTSMNDTDMREYMSILFNNPDYLKK